MMNEPRRWDSPPPYEPPYLPELLDSFETAYQSDDQEACEGLKLQIFGKCGLCTESHFIVALGLIDKIPDPIISKYLRLIANMGRDFVSGEYSKVGEGIKSLKLSFPNDLIVRICENIPTERSD